MFWTSPGSSSGGTTVFTQHMVFVILYTEYICYSVHRITNTMCRINTVVPPDDGPGELRNMYRLLIKLTKYTKNKSCTKLVSFTRQYCGVTVFEDSFMQKFCFIILYI